jgi:hypothetical protein
MNQKRIIVFCLAAVLLLTAFGCKAKEEPKQEASASIADGSYTVELSLTGGTGKAKLMSPAEITVKDGTIAVKLVWSSDKYDYMLVGGEKLTPEYVDGHSVFTVTVESLETPLPITADTVAMSTPHEIEYTVTFDAATLKPAS